MNSDPAVQSTYLFPNGMVATVGWDDQQIGELQGPYTPELHLKILQRSDKQTQWNGFPEFSTIIIIDDPL